MRPLLLLAVLLSAPLLAGCTSLEAAQKSVDEATTALADTKRDLDEARERYDRVKSLQALRAERVDLVAVPVVENGILRFQVNATRDGVAIPLENLTRAPRVILWFGDEPRALLGCDPLTCLFNLQNRTVEMAWEDHADTRAAFPPACGTVAHARCAMPRLVYEGAQVLATTSVSDATA